MTVECFEPIVDKKCKTLILGTAPGPTSLRKKEYYGSPNNYFWDILFRVLDTEWNAFDYVRDSIEYESKKELLIQNKIGLWDVIKICDREGSSDKNIKNEVLNDFNSFFSKYNKIDIVIFNGKGISKLSGNRLFMNSYAHLTKSKKIIRLNSTSSQNPNNPFMILNEWHNTLQD